MRGERGQALAGEPGY